MSEYCISPILHLLHPRSKECLDFELFDHGDTFSGPYYSLLIMWPSIVHQFRCCTITFMHFFIVDESSILWLVRQSSRNMWFKIFTRPWRLLLGTREYYCSSVLLWTTHFFGCECLINPMFPVALAAIAKNFEIDLSLPFELGAQDRRRSTLWIPKMERGKSRGIDAGPILLDLWEWSLDI